MMNIVHLGRPWLKSIFVHLWVVAALGPYATLALADWMPVQEIETHDTWIYTPTRHMGNGKHGLLVVLHGCMQTGRDIKNYGNLTAAAELKGLILVVPEVGTLDQWGSAGGCWDYHLAHDGRKHIEELGALVEKVVSSPDLRIDSDHVYAVGLSSGGTLSLLLGCARPDLFAGIGAIAAPSVGSRQDHATVEGKRIPANNVRNAVSICRTLAGRNSQFLSSQITNIAYGDMDLDGAKAAYSWSPLLITIKW